MSYQLKLSKDHPDGQTPQTIEDYSSDLRKFQKALDIIADESQVLILTDTFGNISESTIARIISMLPNDSYIQHHRHKQDHNGAATWVQTHLKDQMKKCKTKSSDKKKYLIGDWYSTAGYEVPTVIFVTKRLDDPRNATFCQRAKANLVIYYAPNLDEFNNGTNTSDKCCFIL